MSLPPKLIDAHCHLQDERISSRRRVQMIARARRLGVFRAVSCACCEREWLILVDLLLKQTQSGRAFGEFVTPCFGLHPWFVNDRSDAYLDGLRQKLMQFPRASLGEIGFCKSARGRKVPMQAQEQAFREQFQLASELQRPVVIHCVGAYGKLLALVQEMLRTTDSNKSQSPSERLPSPLGAPPSIVLHSFSGANDLVSSFLALEKHHQPLHVFFSFNARQLDPTINANRKAIQSLQRVPLRSLLVETDAPDQTPVVTQEEHDRMLPFLDDNKHEDEVQGRDDDREHDEQEKEGVELNEPLWVRLALIRAAKILEVSQEQLALQVVENTTTAFRL